MIVFLCQQKRSYRLCVLYFYLIILLFRFSLEYNIEATKQLTHLGKRKRTRIYTLTNKKKCTTEIKRINRINGINGINRISEINRFNEINRLNGKEGPHSFSTCRSTTKVRSDDVESKEVDTVTSYSKIELTHRIERGIDKLLYANRGVIEIWEECVPKKPIDAFNGNGGSIEKKKRKKKKQEQEPLFVPNDECPEEINELMKRFDLTFYSLKIEQWKNTIEDIIKRGGIFFKMKNMYNEELDQTFFHFLSWYLINEINKKETGEGEKMKNVNKRKEDISDLGEHYILAEKKRMDEIVNRAARKLVFFQKIITDLTTKYEISTKDIYIDIQSYDVRVQRKNANEKMSDWKVLFLGTGSMYPSTCRGTSSFIFQTTKKEFNEGFLFDCGENTFLSLQKANIKVSQIKNIFITHLHGDHCLGLISVLTMLTSLNKISIYGPEGLYKFLKNNLNHTYAKRISNFCVYELRYLNANRGKAPTPKPNMNTINKDSKELPNTLDHVSHDKKGTENMQLKYIYMNEEDVYPVLTNEYLEITGFPIRHTVPTVGYIIKEKNVKNKFNAAYINEMISNNYEQLKLCEYLQYAPYKIYENVIVKMKENDVFTFPDKTKLTFANAYKEIYKERKIVICQDTYDPSSLEKFAKDADLLIHEATNSLIDLEETKDDSWLTYDTYYAGEDEGEGCIDAKEKKQNDVRGKMLEERWNINNKDLTNMYNKIIAERGHSTANMAGTFAKKIGAKRLILTHFSQRYSGDNKLKNVVVMRKIENEAKRSLGAIADFNSSSGVGSDFQLRVEDYTKNQDDSIPCEERNGKGSVETYNKTYDKTSEDKVLAAWDGLIVYIPHQVLK